MKAWAVAVLWALLSAGCAGLPYYARAYRDAGDQPGPGLLPAAVMEQRLARTQQARELVAGDPARAHELARCEYFRNQLLIASEKARSQLGGAGGQVVAAAERLEQAYNEDDGAFLAVCRAELATPLGEAFAQEAPAL